LALEQTLKRLLFKTFSLILGLILLAKMGKMFGVSNIVLYI